MSDKTVDELADELCKIVSGHGLEEAARSRVASYRAAANYVLNLIAQAKAPSPEAVVLRGGLLGPVTQEEVEALGWDHREDGYEEAAYKLLAHRLANAPRVTVEELVMTTPMPVAIEIQNREKIVASILDRLGVAIVTTPFKGQAPGDEMTDEAVAKDFTSAFLGGRASSVPIQGGYLRMAARARELFRPGSVAHEGNEDELAECKAKLTEANEELDRLRVLSLDCAKLARYAKDLLAHIRVKDEMDNIQALADWYA